MLVARKVVGYHGWGGRGAGVRKEVSGAEWRDCVNMSLAWWLRPLLCLLTLLLLLVLRPHPVGPLPPERPLYGRACGLSPQQQVNVVAHPELPGRRIVRSLGPTHGC